MNQSNGASKPVIQVFRVCHLCNSLNESEAADILKCLKCGKSFLPLNYFERLKSSLQESGFSPEQSLEHSLFRSLKGLIVFW